MAKNNFRRRGFDKKKLLYAGAAVVIVLGAVWYLFLRPPIEIMSDDGSAMLTIPVGALPGGVSAEDISITKVEDRASGDVYAAYEMAPDGLEFKKPVTVTVSVPVTDDSIPMALSESEDGIVILSGSEVSLRDGEATVTVRLSHFSVLVLRKGPFTIAITPKKAQYHVNETFALEMAISAKAEDRFTDYGTGEQILNVYSPPASLGGAWGHRDGILEPEHIDVVRQSFEAFHFNSAEFTCVNVGEEQVFFAGFLSVPVGGYVLEGGEWKERGPGNLVEVHGSDGGKFVVPRPKSDETELDIYGLGFDTIVLVDCIASEPKKEGVIGGSDDAAQPVPPEPPGAPPAPSNEAKCKQVCGEDRYSPETSLETCSDIREDFLCVQGKQSCYDYLIPTGWQTDSGCCCKDEPVVMYAGDRINCANFKGWDLNGFAVDRYVTYPFGESTKSPAECK